jgi:uncharacterized protein
MLEQPPEIIDPLVLVEKRRQLKGSLPLSKMLRLKDILFVQEGEVNFELKFEKDGKIAAVTGVVEAELQLQCQCCLGSISWPVRSRVSLGVVRSIDEADLLPEPYEPLLLDANDTFPLSDLIQDELLLAVPQIPQHDRCETADLKMEPVASDIPKRANPFAVLAKLK